MDVIEGSFRCGIVRVNGGGNVNFVFSAERIPVYEIHFIGRGFICPDSLGLDGPKSCPACGHHAKRMLGLAVSGTERFIQFLELGRPSIDRLDAIRRETDLRTITGTRWNFSRSSNKRPLLPTYAGIDPTASRTPISDTALMKAICRLYMLPSPEPSWDWSTFGGRISEHLHRQLRRQMLVS
jgi:hypothetical protein